MTFLPTHALHLCLRLAVDDDDVNGSPWRQRRVPPVLMSFIVARQRHENHRDNNAICGDDIARAVATLTTNDGLC